MKRRTLLFGIGAVAVAGGATSTYAATLSGSTEPDGDFRVIAEVEVDAVIDLTVEPNTGGARARHTWYFDNITFEGEIDRFEFEYPRGTTWGPVRDRDLTIKITRPGEDEPTEIPATLSSGGWSPVITLDSQYNTEVGGEISVIADRVGNPGAGTYHPEVTWVGSQDSATFSAEMVIV